MLLLLLLLLRRSVRNPQSILNVSSSSMMIIFDFHNSPWPKSNMFFSVFGWVWCDLCQSLCGHNHNQNQFVDRYRSTTFVSHVIVTHSLTFSLEFWFRKKSHFKNKFDWNWKDSNHTFSHRTVRSNCYSHSLSLITPASERAHTHKHPFSSAVWIAPVDECCDYRLATV